MAYELFVSRKSHINTTVGFSHFQKDNLTKSESTDSTLNLISITDDNAELMHSYFLTNMLWTPSLISPAALSWIREPKENKQMAIQIAWYLVTMIKERLQA